MRTHSFDEATQEIAYTTTHNKCKELFYHVELDHIKVDIDKENFLISLPSHSTYAYKSP